MLRQVRVSARPRLSMGQLLGALSRSGVPKFADEARRHEFSSTPGDSDD